MAEPAARDRSGKMASGIARGAMVIAAITVFSRIIGLVRTLVFSQVIGATCMGSAYLTAFQVPSLIAELALGGALTSAMIPVLARSAARADVDPAEKARVGQICSTVLTWAIVILGPLAIAIAVLAGPIASLLTPANVHAHCPRGDVVRITADMIQVFAPQILLYGVSVVFIGLLQAYRRFAGPAVAPVLASFVLIASYFTFAVDDRGVPLARTPGLAELALSLGTTLSVVALLLVMIAATLRLRLTFRPALRLPRLVARQVGGLVTVGIAEFLVADASALVVVAVANGRGETGALVLFNYAFLVFNAIFAVLGISIVTSAFTALSARDGEEFDRTLALSTRAVLLMSCLGAAMMVAIAAPTAHVLARQPGQVSELIAGFVLFAPGLVGASVIANLSRAMLALGRYTLAGFALSGSAVATIAVNLILTAFAPAHLVVAALALGTSIGQTVVAIPVVIVTRRLRGAAALRDGRRAGLAGLVAGAAGAVTGTAVSVAIHAEGRLLAVLSAVVACCVAIAVFALVAYALDRPDAVAVLSRVRQVARRPQAAVVKSTEKLSS
ncbi:MAG TPA: lipid II flippase MurJ [Streptosporangiaceae bacterium]